MGLDIFFSRFKREKYAEYKKKCKSANKDFKEYEETLTKKYKNVPYDLWSDEDKAEYQKRYDALPREENYGKEVGYFRKVNFLLPFFGYEENCEDKEVFLSEFKTLVERCEKVLEHKGEDEHRYAKELLPTSAGFFFGSTEYGDYYYDDVKEVKEWASGIIADTNEEDDIIIMYCWW